MDLSPNCPGSLAADEGNKHYILSVAVLEESMSKSANKSQFKHIEDNIKSMLLAQEILSERVLLLERSIADKNGELLLLREFLSNSRREVRNSVPVMGSDISSQSTKLSNTFIIPGFRILQKSTGFHKYLWVFIHLAILLVSIYFIKNAYRSWHESPIIHSASNTLYEISDIPFPAVTICYPSILNRNFNLMKNIEKCLKCSDYNKSVDWACDISTECNDTDMSTLHFSFTLCDADIWYDQDSSRFVAMKEYFEGRKFIKGEQFQTALNRLHPGCDENGLKLHKTKSEHDVCDSIFQQTLTKQSRNHVCATYNSLPLEDIFRVNVAFSSLQNLKSVSDQHSARIQWTTDNMLDYGYRSSQGPDYNSEPRIFKFKQQIRDKVEICNPGVETDYEIAFHNPGEIPMIDNTNFYKYRFGKNIEVLLKPILTTAHKSIEQFEPSQRGCYFSNEKKLSLFKHYSEKNCYLECKVDCSIKLCGCVPFYLPRLNSSINVCLDFPDEENCEANFFKSFPESCECACLPDCNSLSYDYDTLAVGSTLDADEPKIAIHYATPQLTSYCRYSIVQYEQFVAYTFGFLLMFNGISIMLVIEIIYLIILQLWKLLQNSSI